MNEAQIKTIISGYLIDAQAKMTKENPKLDFKAKWYNLKDDGDINEFIKDTSAIANTPGLDGFVVIGYDEGSDSFSDAYFTHSNLSDTSELTGLLMKRVDRAYHLSCIDMEIDGHHLSILHIPPSFDKPHVIKNYQKRGKPAVEHRVFIRNGSVTRVATKYDFDFMDYDRKNNTPDYAIFISTSKISLHPSHGNDGRIQLEMAMVIENSGIRPIAIKQVQLTFFYQERKLRYVSTTNKAEVINSHIDVANLIIQPFEIRSFTGLTFQSNEKVTSSEFAEFTKMYIAFEAIQATLRLNNGRLLETKVEV